MLTQRNFCCSRTEARARILAGDVLVENIPETKAGTLVLPDAPIRLRNEKPQFVSRGAFKLLAALQHFAIDPKGCIALDVGASTGGFTEVLLMGEARKVYAIDSGRNQLAWSLRKRPEVVSMEKTNARYLKFEDIGEKVDLIVMDVSFISILKLLPVLRQFARAETTWVTLVKPQFEAGREKVSKGGIVKPEHHPGVLDYVRTEGEKLGLVQTGLIKSPLKGGAGKRCGNEEYLATWKLCVNALVED